MNKIIGIIGLIASVALILSIVALVGGNQSVLGGTRFPQGLSADNTSPVAGELRGTDLTITDDAIISGGTLTVTTAAGATSTLTIGKIHTYATSSATQICVSPIASSTGIAPGYSGIFYWNYGSCN